MRKDLTSKTVLGGVYPSISPDVAKRDENVDFIVISEGEQEIIKINELL